MLFFYSAKWYNVICSLRMAALPRKEGEFMDIETMKTVYTVSVTGSVSAAAEMIPCSQSSVSRRVKQAEDELGVDIFERHSNHEAITLTADGSHIIESFVRIMKEYDKLMGTYGKRSAGPLVEGSLSLGIAGNTMITSIGMDSIYSDFIKLYPNVDFDFVRKTEDDVLVMLNLGKLDYGVFVRYIWNGTTPFIQYECNEDLYIENFARHDLMISAAENTQLARRGRLKMKDLADLSFLQSNDFNQLPSRRVPINHIVFFEACRMFGFTARRKELEHQSRAWREQSVAAGLGVTHGALPPRMCTYSGISYLPIEDAPIHAEYFLACKKGRDGREFELVKQWLASYFN